MTSLVYDPAVYAGTNAGLARAVLAGGWLETDKGYRIPTRCVMAVRMLEGRVCR